MATHMQCSITVTLLSRGYWYYPLQTSICPASLIEQACSERYQRAQNKLFLLALCRCTIQHVRSIQPHTHDFNRGRNVFLFTSILEHPYSPWNGNIVFASPLYSSQQSYSYFHQCALKDCIDCFFAPFALALVIASFAICSAKPNFILISPPYIQSARLVSICIDVVRVF